MDNAKQEIEQLIQNQQASGEHVVQFCKIWNEHAEPFAKAYHDIMHSTGVALQKYHGIVNVTN